MTMPKIIRTPKEWVETCRECKGSGHVRRRQHFSLWTPDEYAESMPDEYVPTKLDPMKHRGTGAVPTNAMICVAHGGASIFEACMEGVLLAQSFGRPIAFEFNGAVAVCHADSEPAQVAKTWWKLAYGKTYEQSMAER